MIAKAGLYDFQKVEFFKLKNWPWHYKFANLANLFLLISDLLWEKKGLSKV